jgi:hypothetical protein
VKRWSSILAALAALAPFLLPAACDDGSAPNPARVCVPGITEECNGPGRCLGSQACLPSGEGFGACDCGLAADAGAPPSSPPCAPGERRVCTGEGACGGVQQCEEGGAFGECDCSGASLVVGVLGGPCEADADCGAELECWSASAAGRAAFIGGAAHGYCTRPCARLEDCAAFDPLAACTGAGPDGLGTCLRGCLSKDPLPNEAKCLDRVDQVCLSAAALGIEPLSAQRQAGACLPQCGSDEDCSGRVCDLAQGTCVDERAPGLPIGAACGADADCAGAVCSAFPSGASFCSAACSLDGLGCGHGPDVDPRPAACVAAWLNVDGVSEGRQDLGLCLELCYVTADCTQPDWSCDTRQGGPVGSGGVCVPNADRFPGEPDAGAAAP